MVSLTILVSAAASLTIIPLLVPKLIREHTPQDKPEPRWSQIFERGFEALRRQYGNGLEWAVSHRVIMIGVALSTIALTLGLYWFSPKGFFPQEDIGQITASIDAPQDMSYLGRLSVAQQLGKTLMKDPSVSDVLTRVDHDTTQLSLTLKDQSQRPPLDAVLKQLRSETGYLPGIKVYFSPVQNLRVGGRSAKSSYQYTLHGQQRRYQPQRLGQPADGRDAKKRGVCRPEYRRPAQRATGAVGHRQKQSLADGRGYSADSRHAV